MIWTRHVVEFVIGASNRQGYKQGEFVTKRERRARTRYRDSVLFTKQEYMIETSFIILRIQDFTKVTMPNFGSNPLTSNLKDETLHR